jgi:hypothetical protein
MDYNTGMETVTEKKHIISTPGTCGGKPRIDGARVRVQDIYVWHELQGQDIRDDTECVEQMKVQLGSAAVEIVRGRDADGDSVSS